MTTRFENALRKLIHAFFNDELKKGECSACAVGNMCDGSSDWSKVFCTRQYDQILQPSNYKNIVMLVYCVGAPKAAYPKKVIDATGYTWRELAKVENAFERHTKIWGETYPTYTKDKIMEDQFKGLCAVIDVLCEIEGYDSEEYKPYFEFNEKHEPVNELI